MTTSNAAKTITDVIVEVLPQDNHLFDDSSTTRHVASILAVAAAVSMIAAEFRRRTSTPAASSPYTENFGKGIGVAVAIVLSVVSAGILTLEPAVADTMAAWTGFAALVGACAVLPATRSELAELETLGVHRLYWMPVLFAGSLFAVTFFSVPR